MRCKHQSQDATQDHVVNDDVGTQQCKLESCGDVRSCGGVLMDVENGEMCEMSKMSKMSKRLPLIFLFFDCLSEQQCDGSGFGEVKGWKVSMSRVKGLTLFNWEVESIIKILANGRCCSDVMVKVNVDGDCGTLVDKDCANSVVRNLRQGATRIKALVVMEKHDIAMSRCSGGRQWRSMVRHQEVELASRCCGNRSVDG
eukprot:6280571-Amphidinium_carterae.1